MTPLGHILSAQRDDLKRERDMLKKQIYELSFKHAARIKLVTETLERDIESRIQ